METAVDMDKIVSLCKRRGFIFQSSEIYGGLSSAWDYGPLGVELKRNIKAAWWKSVVHDRDDMVGLDTSILMHPDVWKASGHIENFDDSVIDCKKCHKRMRLDEILTEEEIGQLLKKAPKQKVLSNHNLTNSDRKHEELRSAVNYFLVKFPERVHCFYCKADGDNLTKLRRFNLMMESYLGAVKDAANTVYLRPETAQGIFVNFNNVMDTARRKLPFGIAQIGKSFRNEVTPGNYTFRTREFEQMEIEYFTRPENADEWHQKWVKERFDWYVTMGLRKENLRLRKHGKDELAHYAAACSDVEYNFPFGWSELEGIANRTDFDLKQHAKLSGKELQYQDTVTNEKFFPFIIEPSGGVDRAALAFIVDAYHEEEVEGNTRVVLKLSKQLAPIKVAILPLLKKKADVVTLAKSLKKDLQKEFPCKYDDTASIGKLYRRQDEVGTFFCVTVDVKSLEDKQVTVRSRDTMKQERIAVDRLKEYLKEKLDITSS